jgi:DNA-binding transcriptional LysR family regulator
VEIRQVRYFLAVAELRHFGRAAEQLRIVQPAVSQQIRGLEHEIGTQLFHRTTRTVELTAAGIAFLEHAREIVAAVERAGQAARQVHPRGRPLRVGTGSGLGDALSRVLERLSRGRPDLAVDLVRLPQRERLRQLAEGRLDAAITRGPAGPLPAGIERITVASEALIAALPASCTTPRRRTVRLGEIAPLPARVPDPTQNPVISEALSIAFRHAGTDIKRVPAGTDQDMLALIANGPPTWTVFYPRQADLLARQPARGVAFRRIVSPTVTITTSVMTRADSPEARVFAETFRTIDEAR